MIRRCFEFCLSIAVGLVVMQSAVRAGDYRFQHEHVLGTSFELRVSADSKAAAESVERLALEQIDRLAAILSRYDSSSELMRWQASSENKPAEVSGELFAVLKRAEHWRKATAGAFDVRAGALTELWKSAAARQSTVDDEQRFQLVAKLAAKPYDLLDSGRVQRQDSLQISLDGLAKGYILDAVCESIVAKFPAVTDFSINIGGDLRKVGSRPLSVSVADPGDAAEGSKPLASFVAERPLAMATSGNYRRFIEIAGRKYSHIVDPRSRFPADGIVSASVVAPTAIDADALATALCVLAPDEGLALVESLEHTACLLVTAAGRQVVSKNWPGKQVEPNWHFVKAPADEKQTGLLIDFTLNRPRGGRYRRPYVAVWLEDSDGYPVKTAVLWMQTDQPGPRWHRDLTRWYRKDRTRLLVEKERLIGTVSAATRGPGEYQARFDGTDNTGQPLSEGKYTLCLEAAREHGTYQIIREPVELNGNPIKSKKLKGNVEISAASYRYEPPLKLRAGGAQ